MTCRSAYQRLNHVALIAIPITRLDKQPSHLLSSVDSNEYLINAGVGLKSSEPKVRTEVSYTSFFTECARHIIVFESNMACTTFCVTDLLTEHQWAFGKHGKSRLNTFIYHVQASGSAAVDNY